MALQQADEAIARLLRVCDADGLPLLEELLGQQDAIVCLEVVQVQRRIEVVQALGIGAH